MTCHDVQLRFSLYLYAELDFATEEAVDEHLEECAFCQRALAREKDWHTTASSGQLDIPLNLLSECRRDLHNTLVSGPATAISRPWTFRWPEWLRITPHRWSYQLAVGSFLVFLGFAGARVADHLGFASESPMSMAGLGPGSVHIRDIQPNGPGRVRILYDQIDPREITGSLADQDVKHWLFVAIADPSDPGIRVDSVEMLGNQTGDDVREALLGRLQHDPNAAVRLKALESVRRFSADPATRSVLRSVLEHDADPAVRSATIDVLAPLNERPQLSPELARTLQNLAASESDDYVRGRCLELLRPINAPTDVY